MLLSVCRWICCVNKITETGFIWKSYVLPLNQNLLQLYKSFGSTHVHILRILRNPLILPFSCQLSRHPDRTGSLKMSGSPTHTFSPVEFIPTSLLHSSQLSDFVLYYRVHSMNCSCCFMLFVSDKCSHPS